MKVKFKKLHKNAIIPTQSYDTDFGFDVVATSKTIKTSNCVQYGIGLALEITDVPDGYVAGICFRSRSSIYKKELLLSNGVGTIDYSYRGEVLATFYHTDEAELYEVGERIGQIFVELRPKIEFVEVEVLSDTERNIGGYGSTGK